MAKQKNLLNLDQREAKLGNSINTWALKMGKTETAPAKSIQFTTSISRKEFCSLLREPLAGESFFNDRAGLSEPLYAGKIAPIKIIGDFKDSRIQIFVGIDLYEIELDPVTLTNLECQPLTGGRLTLKFSAQYQPLEQDDLRELERWLAHDVKIAVIVGKVIELGEKQPELALNDSSDTPPAEPIGTPEEEREKARERQIGIDQAAALANSSALDADAAIGDGKTTAELVAAKAKGKRKAKPSHAAH
jgi:hypothetical protein